MRLRSREAVVDVLQDSLVHRFGSSAKDVVGRCTDALKSRPVLTQQDLTEVEEGILAVVRQRRRTKTAGAGGCRVVKARRYQAWSSGSISEYSCGDSDPGGYQCMSEQSGRETSRASLHQMASVQRQLSRFSCAEPWAKSAVGSARGAAFNSSLTNAIEQLPPPAHAPTRLERYPEREAMFVDAVIGRSNFDVLGNIKKYALEPGRHRILTPRGRHSRARCGLELERCARQREARPTSHFFLNTRAPNTEIDGIQDYY